MSKGLQGFQKGHKSYWVEETKEKMSKKMSGINNPMYGIHLLGKKHSEETKKKISLIHKGRKLSDERKKQISESMKQQWLSGKRFSNYKIDHIPKLCINCQKEFQSWPSRRAKYCSKKCYILKAKSKDAPNWKGGFSPSKCVDCLQVLSKTSKWRETIRCKRCCSKGERGSNWQGGKTSIKKLIRESVNYKVWVKSIFSRDNFTCLVCGQKGSKLFVDHIKPFALILLQNSIKTLQEALSCQELWDINNGQTLCEICHKKTDTYGYKTRIILNNYANPTN